MDKKDIDGKREKKMDEYGERERVDETERITKKCINNKEMDGWMEKER